MRTLHYSIQIVMEGLVGEVGADIDERHAFFRDIRRSCCQNRAAGSLFAYLQPVRFA
jgi:hypothetical protein